MPRIRTLKPEHRQHRKVGPLSDRDYRLWVGMILEADDEGRLIGDPAGLRVAVFGYHPDVTVDEVSEALSRIEQSGLIRRYLDDESRPLVEFPSWKDHQKIDRHKASIFQSYRAASSNARRKLDELSTMSRSDPIRSDPIRKDLDHDQSLSASAASPPAFKIPDSILDTLGRCPALGQVGKLSDPAWWQAEARANADRGVDFSAELLKAEAWLKTNPSRAPRKDVARFMHSWFGRANGGE